MDTTSLLDDINRRNFNMSLNLNHNPSKDYSTVLADPSKTNFPRLLRVLCGPSPPHWAIITSFAFVMRCVLASETRES